MDLLNTEEFTVLRASSTSKGYDDGKGNWISADQTTDQFLSSGSIQPLSGDDIKLLPESFKSTSLLKIYTKNLLKSTDQFNNIQADTLIIDGSKYQVQIVEHWRQLSIDHYKVIVGREEKT